MRFCLAGGGGGGGGGGPQEIKKNYSYSFDRLTRLATLGCEDDDDDRPFIVLTETKPSNRPLGTWIHRRRKSVTGFRP